jgi:hypothetical protein
LSISVFGAGFENHLGSSSISKKIPHFENRFHSSFFLFKKNSLFENCPDFQKNLKIPIRWFKVNGSHNILSDQFSSTVLTSQFS